MKASRFVLPLVVLAAQSARVLADEDFTVIDIRVIEEVSRDENNGVEFRESVNEPIKATDCQQLAMKKGYTVGLVSTLESNFTADEAAFFKQTLNKPIVGRVVQTCTASKSYTSK